jgi:hypothetical protein
MERTQLNTLFQSVTRRLSTLPDRPYREDGQPLLLLSD